MLLTNIFVNVINQESVMEFQKENYTIDMFDIDGKQVAVRAFRNRIYVDKPVNPEFQQMNLFAPEQYYEGGSINGYSLKTAPIFMPNGVGGYKPGELGNPEYTERKGKKEANTLLKALMHGYVVVIPAIRGRTQQDEAGNYTGKAPACLIDYKAAVRYLRLFEEEIPGDVNKIITNGTSAGGALSSLMGATGNHPDYEPYFEELGAAKTRDDVFAVSCYCPITNLDNADMAYEWEFCGENVYHTRDWSYLDRPIPVVKSLSEEQIELSKELKAMFPQYLNGLILYNEGISLQLDEDGNGSFKEYMKEIVMESAQRAIDKGMDVSEKTWLTIENNKVVAMEWENYVSDITRMKPTPAFDNLELKSAENDLFGTKDINCKHFTDYGLLHSHVNGKMADRNIVKLLNPMNYIADNAATKAKHFRIRHGECDRDTSLAVSAILTLKLREACCEVDYHAPWGVPHAGDYDLDELFAWIDSICKKEKSR